jgi:hypothetical protein
MRTHNIHLQVPQLLGGNAYRSEFSKPRVDPVGRCSRSDELVDYGARTLHPFDRRLRNADGVAIERDAMQLLKRQLVAG